MIFKYVALAMGIAVIVLGVLNKVDTKSSIIMLGIGVAALSISLVDKK